MKKSAISRLHFLKNVIMLVLLFSLGPQRTKYLGLFFNFCLLISLLRKTLNEPALLQRPDEVPATPAPVHLQLGTGVHAEMLDFWPPDQSSNSSAV